MSNSSSKPSKPKGRGRDRVALIGGHLPTGERFEEGDKLKDLDAETVASLEANGIIESEG